MELFYKHIPPSEHWKVTADYPFFLGNTFENLISATNGEKEEWEFIYKRGAEVAKEEGFDEIAELFSNILEIEKHHSHRFETLAYNLKLNSLFQKQEETQWLCRKCGHIQISKCAPKICPTCKHPQGYFEIFLERMLMCKRAASYLKIWFHLEINGAVLL